MFFASLIFNCFFNKIFHRYKILTIIADIYCMV